MIMTKSNSHKVKKNVKYVDSTARWFVVTHALKCSIYNASRLKKFHRVNGCVLDAFRKWQTEDRQEAGPVQFINRTQADSKQSRYPKNWFKCLFMWL